MENEFLFYKFKNVIVSLDELLFYIQEQKAKRTAPLTLH